MKTKLILSLIVIVMALSLGATRITRKDKTDNLASTSKTAASNKNIGGFISEDR